MPFSNRALRTLTALVHALAAAGAAAPAAAAASDEDAVRRMLVRYEEAIESQDLEKFRAVMPALSPDEQARLERSFQSIRSHDVEITVVEIACDRPDGRVVVRRRDVLNAGTAGEVVTAFSQTLKLGYQRGAWRIVSIER